MRTAQAKTMGNNFVAKSVSLKMSESEHSDSEFYYPGELSDAEMLQLPTHSEATERKSLLSKRSNAAARSGRTDLEPNIFPSGAPTQSIST